MTYDSLSRLPSPRAMKREAPGEWADFAPGETNAGAHWRPNSQSVPGLISVVIPTFNRLGLLRELLASLEDQNWHLLQLIVVVDGSTDGTLKALENRRFRRGIETAYLRQENLGPAAARNRGLAVAKGEFVYFVDSDDLVLRDGLTVLAESLRLSGAPYCVGLVRNTDRLGNPMMSHVTVTLPRIDRSGIVGSSWPIHAALYRREVLDRAGWFDDSLRRGEDTEMVWRVVSTSGPGAPIDDYVALRRLHSEGRISDDLTPRSVGSSGYRKLSRYVHWAEAHGLLQPPVAATAARVLAVARVRLCAAGERGLSQAAADLSRRLEQLGAGRPPLARLAEIPLSPRLFQIILWGLHRGLEVRNALVRLALLRGVTRRR